MDFYEELRMQEKERIVDSLATENQMLQEPKTPTKEQIDEVTSLACMKHKGYSDCCECVLASVGECDLVWLPAFAEAIITEWEKIRNKPN